MTKYFWPSLVNAQMDARCGTELPPLIRSLTETLGTGDRSQWAKNASAVPLFSEHQIAESSGEVPSRAGPKSFMAASFARQIVLPESSKRAGQPACSNTKTTSDFINQNFKSQPGHRSLSRLQTFGTSRKAAGKSSRTENSLTVFNRRLSATHTIASGAYSASNCRQA